MRSFSIPYYSDSSDPLIAQVISAWQARTTVRFTPVTSAYAGDALKFVSNTLACKSDVGRMGGRQTMLVGGCTRLKDYSHELGHVLGFYHEQQRPDRASYVANAGGAGAFDCDIFVGGSQLGRYDTQSLMHYPSTGPCGAYTTVPAGTPIPPTVLLEWGDVRGMQVMYGNEFDAPVAAAAIGANVFVFTLGFDGRLHGVGRLVRIGYRTRSWAHRRTVGWLGARITRSGGRVDAFMRGNDNSLYY